jgi:hypothetical protein
MFFLLFAAAAQTDDRLVIYRGHGHVGQVRFRLLSSIDAVLTALPIDVGPAERVELQNMVEWLGKGGEVDDR